MKRTELKQLIKEVLSENNISVKSEDIADALYNLIVFEDPLRFERIKKKLVKSVDSSNENEFSGRLTGNTFSINVGPEKFQIVVKKL